MSDCTGGRTCARVIVTVLLVVGMMSWTTPLAAAIPWSPDGSGVSLPHRFWLGGDLTFVGEVPDGGPAAVELDRVTLLARWDASPRLALFAEVRVEEVFHLIEGEGATARDAALHLERLYAEISFAQTLTLRVGKAYTPFGLWNPTHRAPLLWSVEEPAIADGIFPVEITGFSLLHRTTRGEWTFDSTVYGPRQDEIVSRPEERGWIFGGRFAASHAIGPAFGSLGFSAAAFRSDRRAVWTIATGADFDLNLAGHEVTGEVTWFDTTGRARAAHGAYLQDAIPLAGLGSLARRLYGVVRIEYFQPPTGSTGVGGLVGVFCLPFPFLVVRVDYLFANRTLEQVQPGLHGSLSVLF